jgi:ubiquinone/menaquinone biosynthesis C-methylase UbiE
MNAEILPEYYGSRAPEYDLVYGKPERQRDLRSIETWLPSALAGRFTLEIACGTGYWTRFIAKAARAVVATDISDETIRRARARPDSAGARFVRGDAYRLPFAGSRFEAAFAGFWFSHVPKGRWRGFIGEMHRTLAPGAKVVLLDNLFVPGNSTPIEGNDEEGNTYQARRLQDGSAYRVLKNFPSEEGLREAIAPSATDIRMHSWEYFWALEYVYGPAVTDRRSGPSLAADQKT